VFVQKTRFHSFESTTKRKQFVKQVEAKQLARVAKRQPIFLPNKSEVKKIKTKSIERQRKKGK
jgi:hypothetical protein